MGYSLHWSIVPFPLASACQQILISYYRIVCGDMAWWFECIVFWPYQYHLTTYGCPCDVSTRRIISLITYPSSTVVSFFVVFFALSTEVRCWWLSCNGRDCAVSYDLSVHCVREGYSVRWSVETVFCMPSSSTVTEWNWTLSTFHGPHVRHNSLLYRRLAV